MVLQNIINTYGSCAQISVQSAPSMVENEAGLRCICLGPKDYELLYCMVGNGHLSGEVGATFYPLKV